MFPHLELSGMLRQHMDDSFLRQVPGATVGFHSARNRPSVSDQRLRDYLLWQHNLADSDSTRYKDVIKLSL